MQAHVPLVSHELVVALGPRDGAELSNASVESIASQVRTVTGPELVNGDAKRLAVRAVDQLRAATATWWLHVDLDVLSTEALPAVDYPQPGGLSWSELRRVTGAALTKGGCVGVSVVIYNPDLDDGAHAEVIVRYLAYLVAACLPGPETGPAPPTMRSGAKGAGGTDPRRQPTQPLPDRFVSLADLYSPRLRETIHRVEPDLPEGIYVGFHGPEFETPAEVRILSI